MAPARSFSQGPHDPECRSRPDPRARNHVRAIARYSVVKELPRWYSPPDARTQGIGCGLDMLSTVRRLVNKKIDFYRTSSTEPLVPRPRRPGPSRGPRLSKRETTSAESMRPLPRCQRKYSMRRRFRSAAVLTGVFRRPAIARFRAGTMMRPLRSAGRSVRQMREGRRFRT